MRRILTLCLVALMLAGCTATPAPTPHSTTSGPPSSRPAATRPDLGDLVIGPDGLGPLVIGQPVPAQPAGVAIVHYVADYCVINLGDGANGLAPGQPWAGAWISAYGEPEAFEVNTVDGLQSGAVGSIAVNDWQLDHRSRDRHGQGGARGRLHLDAEGRLPSCEGDAQRPVRYVCRRG